MKMKRIINLFCVVVCLLAIYSTLCTGCNSEKRATDKIMRDYRNKYSRLYEYLNKNQNIRGNFTVAIGSASLNIGMVSKHDSDSINEAYNKTNVDFFTIYFKDGSEKGLYVVNDNDSTYVTFKEEIPYIVFLSKIATNRGQDELIRYLENIEHSNIPQQNSPRRLHWEIIDNYKYSPLTYKLVVAPIENE